MSNQLLATLTSSLGDGFLPTALQSVMGGGFNVTAPEIDLARAETITGPLSSLDLTSLSEAVSSVRQSGLGGLSALPGVDAITQPIGAILQIAGQLEAIDPGGLFTRLQQAAEGGNTDQTLGLDGVDASIRAVLDLQADSGLGSLLALGSTLLPVNFANEAGAILGKLDGVTATLKVIGALMGLHAAFEKAAEVAANISNLVVPHELASQRRRLVAWKTNTSLATNISTVDAGDQVAIARLSAEVREFLGEIQAFTTSLQRGLGFGDAALTGANLDRLGQTVESLSATLLTVRLDPALALTTGLRDWLAVHLPPDFGTPAASLGAVIAEVQALATDLETQINALPVDRMTAPFTSAVGQVTTVVTDLNNALATATGTIRSVFEHVRQLIDSLNLAGIAETIAATLQPVVQVLEELEGFITEISDAIEITMSQAAAAVKTIKTGILDGAGEVADVFSQVETILADLDMEALVKGMQAGIQAIVDALKQVDLDPYFDTAVDAMDTVSSIIEAVPLSLLPDDMEADLHNAVQPVKNIDFDRDVRQILIDKLETMLAKVDTDILGEIDRMTQEIIAFLQEHDPGETLENLEQDYFDPLLVAIAAINPEEILRPITEVLDDLKDRIADIDVRALVVDQVDSLFTEIIGYYDQCDPEPLLAPVVAEVDTFRNRIIELTGIATWANRIDTLQGQLSGWLDQIDYNRVLNEIDAVYTSMLRSLGGDADGATVMGGFIAGLLSGSVSLRGSSYNTVVRWISGVEDGVETVHGLIGQGLGNLRGTLALVDSLQPELAAAEAMTCYRTITQAVDGLPSDHPLRQQLAQPLAAGSPADLLAPIIANLPAYRSRLETSIRALEQLASSGFSQITATSQTLRTTFQPLGDVQWQLIILARRFGIDPVDKPLLVVIGEILAILRPGTALAPFDAVVAALKAKLHELIDGLIAPVKEAISQVQALLDTINIKLISDELKAVHTQIRTELLAFQPSVLLAEPLDAFDGLKDGLVAFDPFAPVRTAIDTFKQEAEELLGPDSLLRPSVMFAGLLAQYERILELAAQLNVRDALQPVLAELEAIKEQLDSGLGETGEAFARLQEALP